MDFQKVVADVDDADKCITVGYRIRILLHIVKMGLIGLLQTLIGCLLTQSEAALAAALVNEQIDVVARHLGSMLLEVIQRRYGHLQTSFILAPGTFQARQSAGDGSIDFKFLRGIHIVHDGHALGPVEFGHTLLMGTVAGIPQPVESLAFA